MLKKIGLAISLLLLTVVAVAWVKIVAPFQSAAERFGPEGAARDYALQDDKAVPAPPPQQSVYPAAPNSEGNLYWGELHLHTAESFDASLFGTTLGIEDAYRFARGEALKSPGGERMQLSRPLDFVAITDHAEGFGTRSHCGDDGLSVMERAACWLVNEPNPFIFRLLVDRVRGEAPPGDPSLPAGVYQQTKLHPTPARSLSQLPIWGTWGGALLQKRQEGLATVRGTGGSLQRAGQAHHPYWL